MSDQRRVLSTTVDSSNYYMQTPPNCPYCVSGTSAIGVPMVAVWELVKEDIHLDQTIAHYKNGYKCMKCGYEKTDPVVMTMSYTKTISEFEKLVEDMRKWQREYFKHRTDQALQESKKLEKKVDRYLKDKNEPLLFNYNDV